MWGCRGVLRRQIENVEGADVRNRNEKKEWTENERERKERKEKRSEEKRSE